METINNFILFWSFGGLLLCCYSLFEFFKLRDILKELEFKSVHYSMMLFISFLSSWIGIISSILKGFKIIPKEYNHENDTELYSDIKNGLDLIILSFKK